MNETFVKIVSKNKPSSLPDTYCPIDVEKRKIVIGLSLCGFYPEGAKIIGEYDEDTEKLTFYPSYILSLTQSVKPKTMENKNQV